MAKELSTKFSVDLGEVVANSLSSVKAIRKSEQIRKEAEFQRAISNGLSHDAQVAMREAQLEKEKQSSVPDTDYITNLEKSITDTKKLNRFNKYRTRYAENLGELSSGKINEEQYLSVLKSQLNGIDDPDLRLEIQNDIVTGESNVKKYRDTILGNQVKKAKYDGTKDALNEAISRVNVARAEALINNNEDEVTAYDETLSALNSQLSSTKIQDSITDFQVGSSTRGTNPVEKLNYINNQIQSADVNNPIKIGDRTFTSAQQFWTLERDNFLSGNSQVFGNFFEELNKHVKNTIDTAAVRFGYPTQNVLDDAFATFNELRSKPEINPFVSRLDITQATVMSEAVDKLAKTINDVATNNLTFKQADSQLQNIGTKYGIDVSSYRLDLQNRSLQIAKPEEGLVPEVDLKLPKVGEAPPVVTPVTPPVSTPTPPVIPPTTPVLVVPPAEKPVVPGVVPPAVVPPVIPAPISTPPIIEQTPSYTPAGGIGTKSIDGKFTFTKEGWKPITPAISTPPISSTPPVVPTPGAIPPKTRSSYVGSSIVEYLDSLGEDSSLESRARRALEKGIVKSEDEYFKAAATKTNAGMNTKLLDILRKEQA